MKKPYNTTELPVFTALEKGISHRDYFGHAFRWSHVLREAKIGMKILDFGCGHGGLYEMFYRNRYAPARFLGLDIRKQVIMSNQETFPKAEWKTEDLVKMENNYGTDWDIITSFEVLEHIGKNNGDKFVSNITKHCGQNTIVFISTPCYNGTAAANHTYDSNDGRGVVPQELTYQETENLLSEKLDIVARYGTFASIRDYRPLLNEWQTKMFDKLYEYYDSNVLSVIMAPFFPENSRNVLWKCKLKITDGKKTLPIG